MAVVAGEEESCLGLDEVKLRKAASSEVEDSLERGVRGESGERDIAQLTRINWRGASLVEVLVEVLAESRPQ